MTSLPIILGAQNAIDHFFLPTPGSNLAVGVDWAWNFVLGVSAFFFCVVVGIMIFCVFRYRRKHPNQQTSLVTHNTPLEIAWTVIPLIIVLVIFFIGFKGFLNYDTPASNATPIQVECKQWGFNFTYPNGGSDKNLYLMKGEPYVLNIRSDDVLHAVYIPAFRTQRNAVPGRTTYIWFIPEQASTMPLGDDKGGFDLFCTQYCGQGHSTMGARVYVYDNDADGKAAYTKEMTALANPFKDSVTNQWIPYAKVGEKFYSQYGCNQCHAVTEAEAKLPHTGPPWWHLWKSQVAFSYSNVPGFTLGPSDSDKKWEDYVHESAEDPAAKIVNGFSNVMPPQPQFFGNDANYEKLRAIMEYMKSIGTATYTPKYTPEKNPDLFDAKKNPDFHPESLAFAKAAATRPAK